MDCFRHCRAGLLFAGFTLAAGVPGRAQTPAAPAAAGEALTLDHAIRRAIEERPRLAASASRAAAARSRIDQARAPLRPRIDLQFSASEGLPGAPQIFIGGLAGSPFKKRVGGSVTLTQTLLDFGRTRAAVRARRAEAAGSEQALQADRNQTVLEVRQAYFQALQARHLLEVNRQILEQRRLVARQAETLRENGQASRVDVELAEVQVSQAELALVAVGAEIENAYASLGAAIGQPVPSSTRLEEVSASPTEAGPAEAAVTAALRDRPELRQLDAQAKAAESQIAVARAGKRPLFTGIASVGKVNPGPLIENADKPYAVAVVLAFPLVTGGLVEAQVEEAQHAAAAARSARDELANQVRQQVVSALANLAAAEEGLRVAEVQLPRAQDALSLATQRYQVQLGSIVELGQAQVAFANAQNDVIRARYDRALARAAFEYAVGREIPGTRPIGAQPGETAGAASGGK
ncbi:MAG: outer rane efflux protein [Armatimonadetes bacterium]|nr:outer rane efflux protein [Armatimonadota bacterium]